MLGLLPGQVRPWTEIRLVLMNRMVVVVHRLGMAGRLMVVMRSDFC